MSFHSWLQNLRSAMAPSRGQRKHTLRVATHRLHLEPLEDRRLLAFLAPVDYALGSFADDMKSGDFNGDAVPDLATLNSYGGTVSVALGNGDGTFRPAQTSPAGPNPTDPTVGPYPQSLAVGDFNADGNLDLAASTYDYYGIDGHDVLILFGNGDGTFAPAVPQSIPHGYSSYITSGDLNADGKVDLVVTSTSIGGFGGTAVNVLLGHGDGSFALSEMHRNFGVIGYHTTPVLADVNRDGNVDVAVADWHSVKVYLGNGDGTLQAPRDVAADSGVDFVAVDDFNSDGKLDLITATYYGSINVLMGNGDGTFQAPRSIAAGYAPVAGDVNSDGAIDLVVTHAAGVRVLLGNGDGTFALPIAAATHSALNSLVVADFNADGRLDAVGTHIDSSTVSVLLNDGNWPLPPPSPPSIRIGDLLVTEGNTGTRAANFTVTLSKVYGQPVSIAYATANSTATAGSDYQAASGTLTIPAGQTTGTITVLVNGDRLGEANESFFVNLSSPTNAVIGDAQGVATIVDDEPRISISDVSKSEGKKGQTTLFIFTVTLSAASDQPVTMSYQTANGTAKTSDNDYIAKSGTLTFAPGETTKTITIEIKGDSKKESNEVFYLDLFGLGSNALFTKNRGIGTILNDD